MDVDPLDVKFPGILEVGSVYSDEILLITGGRNTGKTAYCQEIIQRSWNAGWTIGGLLAPGRFNNGVKTGYWITNLLSGESRLFASQVPDEIRGFHFGRWTFDEKVMEWGNMCLQAIQGVDLFVIDELGFLEFDLKTGWIASFDILRTGDYRLGLVVIRPECIEQFRQMGFQFCEHKVKK
jgi:nucleoside-triphosphatase THEP1